MALSKSKCSAKYSNTCLHYLKHAIPLTLWHKAGNLVGANHFHPSLIFTGQNGATLIGLAPSLDLPENIRLGWNRQKFTKHLAYTLQRI